MHFLYNPAEKDCPGETSPPHILASGRRRCRAPRRLALCLGASPSVASDHDDCAIRPARIDGRVLAEGMRTSLGGLAD